MPKKKFKVRKKAPNEEIAKIMSKKGFLLLEEVCKLSGVDEADTLLMIRQYPIKPYLLEDTDGNTVEAYMTHLVKKMLASRGRIIPGFNEKEASQRQWLEVFDSAVAKPLDKEWYFPPVNPDPLVKMEEDRAEEILSYITKNMQLDGKHSEKLRLIADSINVLSRGDAHIRPNSQFENFGAESLFTRRRK